MANENESVSGEGRQIGYPCRCGTIWASQESRSRHEKIYHDDVEVVTLKFPDTIALDE